VPIRPTISDAMRAPPIAATTVMSPSIGMPSHFRRSFSVRRLRVRMKFASSCISSCVR
jgi:hypothetical protein